MAPLPLPSPLAFTSDPDPALTQFNVPVAQWLETYSASKPTHRLDGLCTSVVVFDAQGRILLVQRASHDSMPNKWEIPGGAVDAEDETILHGAVRELWEEAGLQATKIKRFIPEREGAGAIGHVFTNRTGTRIFCRFAFEAEVTESDSDKVRLDPDEHQAYVWATEEEARAQRVGELEIPFTHAAGHRLVLNAFRLRREARVEAQAELEAV